MNGWHLGGRTVAITGGSGGIGRATAVALAGLGAEPVLVGRDFDKHQPLLASLAAIGAKASFVDTDLSDLASVARAGRALGEFNPPVSVLINNAGVGGARGVTADGFELAFGVNHLAHFLLTRLLLESMILHSPGRILTLASEAHQGVRFIDWDRVARTTRSFTGLPEYSRSKAANIAFTVELSKRLAGDNVKAVAIHPGLVATGIWRRIPPPLRWVMTRRMFTPELGAAVVVNCATTTDLVSGAYYTPAGLGTASRYATDASTARSLWEKSDEMVARWL